MLSKQTTIAVVLSIIMVMSAGCAGWGTDGPANSEEADGNGEAQTNESPGDDQGTESNDSGTEEEQQGSEENSDTSTSTDPTEESSSEADTNETDTNGPSETDDGETVDGTEETDTTNETETDSSQTGSDQSDESPSSNGGDDNGDGSPGSGDNKENGGEEPSENGENGDSDESDGEDSSPNESAPNESDGSETHTLTVQVYDSDGNPVEGGDVGLTVYDSGAPVADRVTDENGQAHFEVSDGSYEVLVSDVEDAQSTLDMGTSVQGEDTTHIVNLYDPDDDMHLYQANVQVVDEDGNPLTNERVEVSSPPGEEPEEYITDENGEFTIEFENSSETDAVQHEVVVRDTSETIHVERGVQHEQITVSTDTERETHTLTVNAGEAYAVEGVDVTIERHADGATTTKTTGEEGQVTFDVYPGDYTVTGVDQRDEKQSVDVTVPEDDRILLDDMADPAPPEVETTLTVVDQDGDPVEGVTVTAMTSIPPYLADVYIDSEPTDENGQVTVTAHEGQTYSIERIVDSEGNTYDDGGNTLTIDGDGEATITVERPQQDSQQSQATA